MINPKSILYDTNVYTNELLWKVNPYIRRACYDHLKKTIGERVIYDYELLFIKEGNSIITIEDRVYKTRTGDLYIIKPGVRHSIEVCGKALIQPHIHFDLVFEDDSCNIPISFSDRESMTEEELNNIRKDLLENFLRSFPERIQLKNTTNIEYMLFSIIDTWNAPTLYPEIELKYRFLRLLHYLLAEITWERSRREDRPKERAKMMKMYMERYTNRVVTLNELANVYHIDKSYVARLFKETYGITPTAYHMGIRIMKAKEMIRVTNLTLSQIANQLGFNSLQDFSRAFKRLEGVSPSALRKDEEPTKEIR